MKRMTEWLWSRRAFWFGLCLCLAAPGVFTQAAEPDSCSAQVAQLQRQLDLARLEIENLKIQAIQGQAQLAAAPSIKAGNEILTRLCGSVGVKPGPECRVDSAKGTVEKVKVETKKPGQQPGAKE